MHDRRASDHPAVIWEGEQGGRRQLTYSDLHAQTCRLANASVRLGIGKGDAIGLFLPLVPEAVIAFLACADRRDRRANLLGLWCAGRRIAARRCKSQGADYRGRHVAAR